jgi:excinuclease ABC subunit A
MLDKDNTIEVQGARVHNLKNIDVSIPVKTGCITGLSGSGKSSSHLILFMPKDSVGT